MFRILKRYKTLCCCTFLYSLFFTAHASAVVFQAEDYSLYFDTTVGNSGAAYRNDNVDIEPTIDTNGGFSVGWIAPTEWLVYNNLVIPTSGTYTINLRVATALGGRVAIDLNGGTIKLGTATISSTGGWQNWKTVSITANINAGTYQIGVYAETGDWNFNWIEVIASSNNTSSQSSASNSSSQSSIQSSGTSNSSVSSNVGGAPAGYSLVWQDEFETPGLPNSSKWDYDTEANSTGWYNNEKQYYAAARLKNSEVKDGKLIITAYKERFDTAPDYGNQEYTSARLITNGKASWTYGHFDIRAKLPCGLGTWPAIWTLGTSNDDWPANGEIDIMEHIGREPTTINGTVWTPTTAGTWGDNKTIQVPDACSAFHNYQMTWTADKITFSVDNIIYHTYTNNGSGPSQWPFNTPQYLILNLALGGDFAGTIDDSIFPRSFEVEYVRIYQQQ